MATAPAPFVDLGSYGATSAQLNQGGNPSIPQGAGGSYGVMPGTTYATGENLSGLSNGVAGIYNNTPTGTQVVNSFGQSPQSLPGPSSVLGASTQNPPTTSPTGGNNGNTGPGGITLGSYNPQSLTQDQRNWLWLQNGHSGAAPTGYGGEGGGSSSPTTNAAGVNIQDIINAYNQANQTLQGFVPILQNQAQVGQQAVNQSVQDITNQANTGEDQARNTADSATKQQALALQTALGGNNAYAASFGSGLSSFGQGLNNQTYQSYGNTMGGIQNNLQNSLQQFENQKNSAASWAQNQIAGIQNSLQQGLQQVALNSSMTDVQKATKVADIQQQAQAQQNAIQSIVAQLQANIENSRQNTLASAALYSNTNPTLASNITNLANQFAQQGNYNVGQALPGGMPGMYGTNQKLYGSNLYPYSTNG